MSEEVSKKDIPTADDMREPYLDALKSGKQKSVLAVEKEVVSALGLSIAQRNYTIKGSMTTMLSNRLKSTRILLQNDGLIYSPKHGKVQLTEAGKRYLEEKERSDLSSSDASSSGSGGQEDASHKGNEQASSTSSVSSDQAKAHDKPPTKTVRVVRRRRPAAAESNDNVEQLTHDAIATQPASESIEFAQPVSHGNVFSFRKVAIVIAALVVLAIAFGIVVFSGNSAMQPQAQTEENETSAEEKIPVDEEEIPVETPSLSFIVDAPDASDSNVTAVVHVVGETDDGEKIDHLYRDKVNTPRKLNYGAGTYLFALVENSIVNGNKAYKHDGAKVVFSGENSLCVKLNLITDEELTKAKEEEARAKAEEEARAKAEAEERARVESEQKALAEQQEREQGEMAKKAATVALTNSLADDVFASDGNTHDPSRYHSYSDRSGFYLQLLQDGRWSKKGDSVWHVDNIRFSIPNSHAEVKASLDVQYNGDSFIVSNITGMLAIPGKESYGTDLKHIEQWQPDGFSALNVALYLLE